MTRVALFFCRCLALSLLAAPLVLPAQPASPDQSVDVVGMAATAQRGDQLLPVRWDPKTGKLYLGIPLTESNGAKSTSYILYDSLPYGVGQNDLGMDRGQLEILSGGGGGGPRLVHFERVGPKVLLVEENTQYRTGSTDPAEELAVQQSFPTSVLAGFHIAGEASGLVVVDATDYFLRDIHGVAEALAAAKQGSYRVDENRSTIDPEHSKAFPLNTEIEAELTLVNENPSDATILADVTPDVHALTVHERQSFLKLPPPGYVPRRYSPRSGYFDISWREMNTPLGVDTNQQFIPRHRLQKKDPNCTSSCEAVQPIVYYIDRGAPEPLRSALQEGCSWWDQAFQAAGWAPGTFQVKLLPEDADPMDARYNIIQWVHRFNRGWSYGDALSDPRTGEILKGNVTLGSLRGRQDYVIAEALLAPYKDGKVPDAEHDAALAMVLQRIRQLAAHETGHTLGLMHNYAASTMPHTPDQTMSVMEYPHPWITLDKNGVPDLSQAYSAGIGVWDKVAIDYGYREFDRDGKPIEDSTALEAILHGSESRGVRYLSDADARPFGSASPIAHLWDNGTNAAAELNRILEVRKAALARFGPDAIRPGAPMGQMEITLVPLYLLYRYQAEAATKIIGGLDYRYTVRGDEQKGPQIVPAAEQREALAAVVKTLSPEVLTLPEALLKQLPPRTPGMNGVTGPLRVEGFASHTSVTFDSVATAESAADMTLTVLFNAARANRLVQYHVRDAAQPTLDEVIDAALRAAGSEPVGNGMPALIGTAVKARIVESLFRLAANPETSFTAHAIVIAKLHAIAQSQPNDATGQDIRSRIAAFEREPEKFKPSPVVPAPPGMPIGDDDSY